MGIKTPTAGSTQYALAMTVHEVLSGTNVMAGPSPSATIVNQMNLNPSPPLHYVIAGIPLRLASAVDRALSKIRRSDL